MTDERGEIKEIKLQAKSIHTTHIQLQCLKEEKTKNYIFNDFLFYGKYDANRYQCVC